MTCTVEIGDAVRVTLSGGLFLHGSVQETNDEQVKVRGRWFPASDVKTEEQIEDETRENVRQVAREKEAERVAKAAAEAALKSAPKVPVIHPPTGDYATFVAMIQAAGYTLYVRSRQDGVDDATAEYADWTDGDALPNDALYTHLNDENAWMSREWRLRTKVEIDAACPFPLAEAGTLGCGYKGEPCGLLYENGTLEVNWNCIVAELVRNGLRAQR